MDTAKVCKIQMDRAALLVAVIISSVIYCAGRFKTRFYKHSWIPQLIAGNDKRKTELINESRSLLLICRALSI